MCTYRESKFETRLEDPLQRKMEAVLHAVRFLQNHGSGLPEFVDMMVLTSKMLMDACDESGSNNTDTAGAITARVFSVLENYYGGDMYGLGASGYSKSPSRTKVLSELPVTTGNLIYRAVNGDRTNFTDANIKSIYALLSRMEEDAVSPLTSYRHEHPVQIDDRHFSIKLYNECNGAEATVILTYASASLLSGH